MKNIDARPGSAGQERSRRAGAGGREARTEVQVVEAFRNRTSMALSPDPRPTPPPPSSGWPGPVHSPPPDCLASVWRTSASSDVLRHPQTRAWSRFAKSLIKSNVRQNFCLPSTKADRGEYTKSTLSGYNFNIM